jgi:hypothetical protein
MFRRTLFKCFETTRLATIQYPIHHFKHTSQFKTFNGRFISEWQSLDFQVNVLFFKPEDAKIALRLALEIYSAGYYLGISFEESFRLSIKYHQENQLLVYHNKMASLWKSLSFDAKLQLGMDELEIQATPDTSQIAMFPQDALIAMYGGFAFLKQGKGNWAADGFENAIRLTNNTTNETLRNRAIHKLDQVNYYRASDDASNQDYIQLFDLDPNEEKQWYSLFLKDNH